MEDDFSMLRGERRSFFCPNTLWVEIEKSCANCISISTFVRQAVLEKLIRENPEKEEYFKELISGNVSGF